MINRLANQRAGVPWQAIPRQEENAEQNFVVACSWHRCRRVASPHADAPFAYAIRGARIVTAAGAPIASGTIVLRGGLVEAIGADVAVPGDARVIDGAGLTVYPGLIDMGTAAGIELPRAGSRSSRRPKRPSAKRDQILRPQLEAAEHIRPDAPGLTSLASVGITSVLATPSGEVVKGRSALVNVTAPEEDPQIGAVADARSGLVIVRAPVALHVEFTERPRGDGYPASLMGVIAFVRQAFLDGQHHQAAADQYQRVKAGVRGRSSTPRSTLSSRLSPGRCRSRSRPTPRGRFCVR